MRIGIDGYNLAMPHGTGIASYGLTLARVLRTMDHHVEGVFGIDVGQDPALRETLFFDRLARPTPPPAGRRQTRRARRRALLAALSPLSAFAREVPLTDDVDKGSFAETLPSFDRLVSAARLFERAHQHFHLYGRFLTLRMSRPPDIMHWTYPVPVRVAGARNVYTLHDLVPLKLPHTTLDVKSSYYRLVARCVRDAAAICTVSRTSADDIAARFDIAPERIVNTFQVSALRAEAAASDAGTEAAMIQRIFGLGRQGYYLFYGAIEPKKNVGRLIEAYLASGINTPLVIVSSRAWQSDGELGLLAAAERSGALDTPDGPRIVRLEHMSRRLLVSLVRGARAVLFPSLYEGFGLPVLEALQLGTPVLTSDRGSLPEVVGDAAVMVDPYDVGAIGAGLLAIESDAALRRMLTERGGLRAATFSEAAYRDRLTQLYTAAMAARR